MKYIEEYAEINGLEHYIVHFPKDKKDVCLFIHGGPGQSYANFAYHFDEGIKSFNMVYYDQRGTGKTYLKNQNQGNLSIEQLYDDLKKIIDYILDVYKIEKIYLMAHSFGTILGTIMALRHPEKVKAYFGIGQMIDIAEGERIGFNRLKSLMPKPPKNMEGYPKNDNRFDMFKRVRQLQHKYHVFYRNKDIDVSKVFKNAPTYIKDDSKALKISALINKNLIMDLVSYKLDEYKYECPVFFICGANDYQTPTILVEKYFEKVQAPVKELCIIDDAGHCPMWDNNDSYLQAISNCISLLK